MRKVRRKNRCRIRLRLSGSEVPEIVRPLEAGIPDDFTTLGRHINNAKMKYDEVEKKSAKFSNRLELIGGEDEGEKGPVQELSGKG